VFSSFLESDVQRVGVLPNPLDLSYSHTAKGFRPPERLRIKTRMVSVCPDVMDGSRLLVDG
jgi:hypothetical protein